MTSLRRCEIYISVQFSHSVVSDSLWPHRLQHTRQASLSSTNSQSLLKLMFIELVMPSNHLILCHPLLSPSIFPRIRVFSNESFLHIRWPILGRSDLYSLTLTSMTTGKTIALTRWTFVGKVMSLLFNMQSRLVITFLPRSKHFLISWHIYIYIYIYIHIYTHSACGHPDGKWWN